MKQKGLLTLVIILLSIPLGTLGAQEDNRPLPLCSTEEITSLMNTLLPVTDALAEADDLWPEAKLDWVELPVEEFVMLSLRYASIDDMLAASAVDFPVCADSILLVSRYDALINEMTLWATEMALHHTYQSDPDDVTDAFRFKSHAMFHMEQAEKHTAAIAAHTGKLLDHELMSGLPACSEDELTGQYATFLTMMETSVPLTLGQISAVTGPSSSQLLTVDSFNMTLSDMPGKLPYPVPECAGLTLKTITQYTELADLAIFGVQTKLATHLAAAGNIEDASVLATIVEAHQDTVMALFAKWGGQTEPEEPAGS